MSAEHRTRRTRPKSDHERSEEASVIHTRTTYQPVNRRTARLRFGGLLTGALLLALAFAAPATRAGAQEELVAGFPMLTLVYTDSDGPGQIILRPQGHDPATGGWLVTVTLTQDGRTFTGEGFVRGLDSRTYVAAFNVSDGGWGIYFFTGLIRRNGEHWTARGQYRAIGRAAGVWDWRAETGPSVSPVLSTTVQLNPVAGAGVRGTVALTALPLGETQFSISLTGLQPNKSYTVLLRAGTPARPSASVLQVATLTADASGRATAGGLLRYRGTESIILLDIADGNHFVSVAGSGDTLATGVIPALQPLG